MLVKTLSRKFHRLCARSFGDSAKAIIFKDSIMAVETCLLIQARENVFYFLTMSREHFSMGWKFQETLKSFCSIYSCAWHIAHKLPLSGLYLYLFILSLVCFSYFIPLIFGNMNFIQGVTHLWRPQKLTNFVIFSTPSIWENKCMVPNTIRLNPVRDYIQ